MWSTGISANHGSHLLKTSGFSESIAQPATKSEQHHVNIVGRVSSGSNSMPIMKGERRRIHTDDRRFESLDDVRRP
jgi:hypothetical protein